MASTDPRQGKTRAAADEHAVSVPVGDVTLAGTLAVPRDPRGVVVFAHGSGSGRHSPRNRAVARVLFDAGLATLLMDLLTTDEEAQDMRTAHLRFDIPLLAGRVVGAIDWLAASAASGELPPRLGELPVGCFGASTGAAAALIAAAERPDRVRAVVSRGGRPDLAGDALGRVRAPTLLIVGGRDPEVIQLNELAQAQMTAETKLEIVPGATHLFEEPGTLEQVAALARDWFLRHLSGGEPPTQTGRFRDRTEAGRLLAERLREYRGRDDVVVLALPRGGVPVAFEVARELDAPLDVFLVRKLGVPGHEELALGAIATGGTRVLNRRLVDSLGLPPETLEAIDATERRELQRREAAYRGERPPPDLAGKTVILVDDGLATGSTMWAAVLAVKQEEPARVVVAVPVADPDVCANLGAEADDVVCLRTPRPLRSVGSWYEDFGQTSDDEVRELLGRARRPPVASTAEQGVRRLTGHAADYDPLIDGATRAGFVLLGEASHGTHELYRERAEITKRLIAEAGVTAVAVEADWPDAYRVNRFVRGAGDDVSAEEALSDFRRFPVWMWRNTDVAEFVAWLREWNDGLPEGATKVGFYGLDLYSLHSSMDAVISYVEQIDPEAAERARERYSCFDHFGRDPQVYGYETGLAGGEPCEAEAVDQLVELRSAAADVAAHDGHIDDDDHFFAEQNARLVVNAERYYRAMFRGGHTSWNLRDSHMVETLEALVGHLTRRHGATKVAVWEHNSHIGDARATEMGQSGRLNVGQLMRERHRDATLVVGFTTYTGTVTAAANWGEPAERKRVRRALAGSWEELFHEMGVPGFLVDTAGLHGQRLERAIGVVYRPETERLSHYFHARIAGQFDAVIHIDETHAVEPLDRTSAWEAGELPETYPWGV